MRDRVVRRESVSIRVLGLLTVSTLGFTVVVRKSGGSEGGTGRLDDLTTSVADGVRDMDREKRAVPCTCVVSPDVSLNSPQTQTAHSLSA